MEHFKIDGENIMSFFNITISVDANKCQNGLEMKYLKTSLKEQNVFVLTVLYFPVQTADKT